MLCRQLRSIALAVITTCAIASGYAAETLSNADDNAGGGLADDISASLVVCARGPKFISSFGHCSIHMSCPSAGLDNYYTYLIVASPRNVRRFFTEGVCTGHFEAQKWDEFSKDYVEQNRRVTEYRLNLTTDEVRQLWLNLDKETYNSVSRTWSFLHSQCTSISADVIRNSLLNERIEYVDLPESLTGTFREYTDFAVANYPWYLFCFQSILGTEGEQKGTIWEKLPPTVIYPVWSQASIVDATGNRRPVFTSDSHVLVDGTYAPSKPSPLTPNVVFGILLVVSILLTIAEVFSKKTRKTAWVYDAILLCAQTLLGLFFTWLLLFSRASWMTGNLMPIVFNPLPAILWILFHKKSWFCYVYIFYAIVLAGMIVATPFMPQLQWGHALLFATFLTRAAAHFWLRVKKIKPIKKKPQ